MSYLADMILSGKYKYATSPIRYAQIQQARYPNGKGRAIIAAVTVAAIGGA